MKTRRRLSISARFTGCIPNFLFEKAVETEFLPYQDSRIPQVALQLFSQSSFSLLFKCKVNTETSNFQYVDKKMEAFRHPAKYRNCRVLSHSGFFDKFRFDKIDKFRWMQAKLKEL